MHNKNVHRPGCKGDTAADTAERHARQHPSHPDHPEHDAWASAEQTRWLANEEATTRRLEAEADAGPGEDGRIDAYAIRHYPSMGVYLVTHDERGEVASLAGKTLSEAVANIDAYIDADPDYQHGPKIDEADAAYKGPKPLVSLSPGAWTLIQGLLVDAGAIGVATAIGDQLK